MLARLGRTTVAASLALAVLAANPGAALADPRLPKVRAKLVKLNERADELVEKYNQATEAYKSAKKKYDTLNAELGRKDAQADALRKELVAVAVDGYQYGPVSGWQRFAFEGSPEVTLGSMASLEQMTRVRAAKIAAYEAATKDLRDRRTAAKGALAEADGARDKVRGEKTKVEKLVGEQTKLLRRLNAFKSGDPSSPGMVYSGPASGNARRALQFAFAQIGKPYRFGGTGPGSYDCSGLTQAAWRTGGVSLPRTTWTQWSWGAARQVPLTDLQPGDLLFSKGLGHMGMYAGNGKMVHAPQTGDVVKVVDLDDYWRTRLLGAVRP
ncbi:C40 family peptidase [Nonomuraea solani]|uniref:C40 family peptidase n=1 Tax=Nonomuraea solani TaxID=1144553 RepID=UPI001F2A3D3D|nr:C40 family peptidase [Nonomuraea solani]